MLMNPQRLLQGPGELLDADGNLTQAGWATQPLLDANLEDSHFYRLRALQKLRLKIWDYYAVTTPRISSPSPSATWVTWAWSLLT